MTTEVASLGSADTVAPPLQPAAHGVVAVNGSADTPFRSGPPSPRRLDGRDITPSPAKPSMLSPGRAALASHLATLAKLAAEAEHASKPVQRLRDQLASATATLGQNEAALANLDSQRSAELSRAAREGIEVLPLLVSYVDAEDAVNRSRRDCNNVRQALAECEADWRQANANLNAAHTHFDALALAILSGEEHNAKLERCLKLRDQFYLAEIELLSLHQMIGARGREIHTKTGDVKWLQKLETLHEPWMMSDGLVERRDAKKMAADTNKWASVLQRLQGDATARFE
jgi:hypothetical protein